MIFFNHSFTAKGDSTRTKYRINVNAGVILARTFSNYPLRKETDAESVTRYLPVNGAPKYKPGFFIGTDFLMLPKERFKLAFGISFSQTSAQYHSSYTSEGRTTRSGFTKLTRATENDYQISYTSLNFHAGFRNRIFKSFFLNTQLLLNSPLRIVRILNGSTETVYSNASGATESDIIFIRNEETKLKQKPANLSLRLTAEYQFKIGNSLARILFFRNFGLLYALPWWGVGVSYTVR